MVQVNDIHQADVCKITPAKFSGSKEVVPLYFRKVVSPMYSISSPSKNHHRCRIHSVKFDSYYIFIVHIWQQMFRTLSSIGELYIYILFFYLASINSRAFTYVIHVLLVSKVCLCILTAQNYRFILCNLNLNLE